VSSAALHDLCKVQKFCSLALSCNCSAADQLCCCIGPLGSTSAAAAQTVRLARDHAPVILLTNPQIAHLIRHACASARLAVSPGGACAHRWQVSVVEAKNLPQSLTRVSVQLQAEHGKTESCDFSYEVSFDTQQRPVIYRFADDTRHLALLLSALSLTLRSQALL
jgi:hypothetical protein